MKVVDIPKFFRPPNYCVTSGWNHLERTLDRWDGRSDEIDGNLGLDLNPDFQRGHVWTEDKQIAFVEFCLKGGQSSRTLLFNHPGWQGSYKGLMVLVDGKQRLEAVMKFIHNELPIFNGNLLDDFDDPKRLLRSSQASFEFKVNNLKTRKDVMQWYLQLNSGGVVHTQEELDKVYDLIEKET